MSKNKRNDYLKVVDEAIEKLHVTCRMGVDDKCFTADEFWAHVENKNREMKEMLEGMNEIEFMFYLVKISAALAEMEVLNNESIS